MSIVYLQLRQKHDVREEKMMTCLRYRKQATTNTLDIVTARP